MEYDTSMFKTGNKDSSQSYDTSMFKTGEQEYDTSMFKTGGADTSGLPPRPPRLSDQVKKEKPDLSFNEQMQNAAMQAMVFAGTTRHMMTDVTRGVKQMMAENELFGYGEEDLEDLKQQQALVNTLMESEEYGSSATQGLLLGAVAEPTGLMIPGMKSATLLKTIGKGSAIGATYGGLGYADEERGQTRLGNIGMGAAFGGALGGVMKGGSMGLEVLGNRRAMSGAHKYVSNVENEYANLRAHGMQWQEAQKVARQSQWDGGKGLTDAVQLSGRSPLKYMSKIEAEEHLKYLGNPTKALDHPLAKGLDTILGSVHTRVKGISKPIAGALRKLEFQLKSAPHKVYFDVDKMIDANKKIAKASPVDKAKLDGHLNNGRYVEAEQVMARYLGKDTAAKHLKVVRTHLDQLGKDGVKYGILDGTLENYFPRMVKDFDGLMAAMGRKEQEKIADAVADLTRKLGRAINESERSDLLNRYLRQQSLKLRGKPGYAKERKMAEVPAKYQQFYHTPEASLHSYVRNSINDIEKAKFFGKTKGGAFDKKAIKLLKQGKDASPVMDLSKTIGAYAEREGIKGSQLVELKALLNARFGVGETAPPAVIQVTKNLLYAALLGNPLSALTQLGDVGVAMYINGITPVLRAAYKTVTGKSDLKIKDFGLVDALAEEFANTGKTAKWMRASFKWGGFEAMDRFGKSVLINSSFDKLTKWAGTIDKPNMKGLKKLHAKYGETFGDEYDDLVKALQRGDAQDDNVRLMIWHELSDVPPISLSELPEAYLNNPKLRIAYMFKTFMLKQMDVIRQTAFKKMRSGQKAEGLADLARYMIMVGVANTGAQTAKDAVAGKDIEVEPMDFVKNLLKTFAWSEYTAKQVKEKGPITALGAVAIPPVDIIDDMILNPEDLYQYAPIAGRLLYNINENWL